MDTTLLEYQEAVEAYGGIRPAARALGIAESTIRMKIKRAAAKLLIDAPNEKGFVPKFGYSQMPAPTIHQPGDRTKYFILTAAQDDTAIHEDFWKCLNVYADYLEDCEIIVSGFTYSKKLFEEHDKRAENIYFYPEIDAHIVHNQVMIGDDLVFCGEMNTLPTAVTPLSGFQTYTRHRSGIFPHVKVQLESVPTMKNQRTRQVLTTGAITRPNYIRKKAGIKAEFDHIIGAVIVALKPDGTFFYRHIQATDAEDGSFYDLDCHVTRDGVTEGNRVAGITYGDVHIEKVDPFVALATWGYDTETRTASGPELQKSVKGFLRPEFEFFHDICDFSTRNHHNIKDHHFLLKSYFTGKDKVEDDLGLTADFLAAVQSDDTISVVVQSNHDNAYVKWIKTGIKSGVQFDPANYEFWLESELMHVRELKAGITEPPMFETMVRRMMRKRVGAPSDNIIFHPEDTSFVVKNVECGMHGHLGANGMRASPNAFVRMGAKSNTGHVHSSGITSGNYRSGVCALEMGYNKGLSSWTITHTIIYPNGRRTLITYMNGDFFE